MALKIVLYILIVIVILFGLYKMIVDDEKGVGYASFVFAILVFIVTLIPADKKDSLEPDEIKPDVGITETEDETGIQENEEEGETIQDGDTDIANGADEVENNDLNENDDRQGSEPDKISLNDIAWLKDEKIHKDVSEITMRGEQWSNCIGFGSSNINSDGTSVLIAVCDQKYSKFTAEIAPQEGFDTSEEVTLYIYGACNDEQIIREEYKINYLTRPIEIDINISGVEELYFWKEGNYSQGRIAGQFINGYTGMGVLMREATLYK